MHIELSSPGANCRPTLPGLGLSEVQVIDAVQVHVFRVPGKGCLPHAEVQVRRIHTLDGNPTLLFHQVQDGSQSANVPLIYMLQRMLD